MIKVTRFVRQKRSDLKMNQHQFAAHCKISQSTVSNIEMDLEITEDLAEKIAYAFRLPLSAIADEPERVELRELAERLPIDAIRKLLDKHRTAK